MAYHNATTTAGVNAGEDLAQFRFVKMSTTAHELVYADAGENATGVTACPASNTEAVPMWIDGVVKVEIGAGGLTPGDIVAAGASGVAVEAGLSAYRLGVVVTGGAAGEIASILFDKNGLTPAS